MKQDLRYLNHLAELGKGHIHPHGRAATRFMIDSLMIKDRYRLLEIGCGTGETITEILSAYKVTIDATDILPAMLKRASQRIKLAGKKDRVKFHKISEADELPFENLYFDRIYSESVLGFQDSETIIKLMKEVYRTLKDGGIFVSNDAIWKEDAAKEDIERINRSCIEDFGLTQASPMPWKINDWLRLFKETGFQVLSSELLFDTVDGTNGHPGNFKMILSESFSKYFRLKSFLSPALMRGSRNFSLLLKKHADDGKYIESRLFVLRKH